MASVLPLSQHHPYEEEGGDGHVHTSSQWAERRDSVHSPAQTIRSQKGMPARLGKGKSRGSMQAGLPALRCDRHEHDMKNATSGVWKDCYGSNQMGTAWQMRFGSLAATTVVTGCCRRLRVSPTCARACVAVRQCAQSLGRAHRLSTPPQRCAVYTSGKQDSVKRV